VKPYLLSIPCVKAVNIVFWRVCGIPQVLVKVSAGDDEQHALFFHTGSLDPVDHFTPDLDDAEG
jgi:hypothetical protein